ADPTHLRDRAVRRFGDSSLRLSYRVNVVRNLSDECAHLARVAVHALLHPSNLTFEHNHLFLQFIESNLELCLLLVCGSRRRSGAHGQKQCGDNYKTHIVSPGLEEFKSTRE